MRMNKGHPIHWPDRLFVNHCYERFGVNRGVYNTVDEYLFRAGMIDIAQRREAILEFLSYLYHVNGIKSNGKINLGSNGLSIRLKEYWVKRKPYNKEGGINEEKAEMGETGRSVYLI